MRILFYFILYILAVEGKITIRDAGVAKFTKGDIGMIFYITLCNSGSERYHIISKMQRCCETITKDDVDCNIMTLIGGDVGFIYPHTRKNISLLYPNMYLFNRKGECLITIKYRDDLNATERINSTIPFNTIVKLKANKPPKNADNAAESENCKTVDEDPFEECEPVDCHMKYLGKRNYFNYKISRCEKLPTCVPNPPNQTPNTIYYPRSNKCNPLESPITADDLKDMEKNIQKPQYPTCGALVASANVRCHHGMTNNETGFCTCDNGWTSPPTDVDQYEPGLFNYHMCNVQIGTWCSTHRNKIKMTLFLIAVCGAIIAIGLVMISCCCHLIYKLLYCKCNSKPLDKECVSPKTEPNRFSTETELAQTNPSSDSISTVSPTLTKSLSERTLSSAELLNLPASSPAVTEISTTEKETIRLVINRNTYDNSMSRSRFTRIDSSSDEDT